MIENLKEPLSQIGPDMATLQMKMCIRRIIFRNSECFIPVRFISFHENLQIHIKEKYKAVDHYFLCLIVLVFFKIYIRCRV